MAGPGPARTACAGARTEGLWIHGCSAESPGETPPAEGSIGEAHEERPDGGVWEHPAVWIGLIVLGAVLFAGFFAARVFGLA